MASYNYGNQIRPFVDLSLVRRRCRSSGYSAEHVTESDMRQIERLWLKEVLTKFALVMIQASLGAMIVALVVFMALNQKP